jgi:hypothetical protein
MANGIHRIIRVLPGFGLYEISTTVWKIEAGNCIPDARRRS